MLLGFAFFVTMIIAVGSQCARAWSNGGYSSDATDPDYGTHDWIADNALILQTRDVDFLSLEFHARFLLGTEAPDNPDYIGDTTNHHVYFGSSGQLEDDSAAVRASQTYSEALADLKAGDFSSAAFYTGAMVHYISDMGVYAHTMGNRTDWGVEAHHSDYESWFESHLSSFVLPTGTSFGRQDAYDAAIGLARNSTFGAGTIMSNIWMDQHYNWSDEPIFRQSAMGSLYASVYAVASAIDNLVTEFDESTSKKNSDSNLIIYSLTIAAVLTTSGVLLIRSTRRHH